MILPNQEIERLSTALDDGIKLISPFNKTNLRSGSYDLTVGDEYYIGQAGESSTLLTKKLNSCQSFTTPPHAICFILVAENIHLPSDVTAKVSLRMTHIYAGMVLTSQPPFDPGYNGRVVLMLHNLSSEPFHLKCGERVATIEFMRLENEPNQDKIHRSVRTLEEQLAKPIVSSLTEIARMSTSAYDKVYWLSGQMLFFAALIVAVLAVPGFFSYSNLLERLGDQRDRLKDANLIIEDYKRDLEKMKRTVEEIDKKIISINHRVFAQEVNTIELPRSDSEGIK